ncbi:hypothetical protein DLAC_03184 [Tieghemostelium lacteum]|uniref:CUE domain-containing protein n=1 Tax=Tieghemostelium lacteum TaxID=361077 RepID=A0A152A2G8_TIELA|nr:hypothetical protein DLAC_03184 [Tieghemostelium lacteum]|eukprot:KYR00428.1 hypothetical protein DLAC_03184 [Tieghemostelium lacteum]
MSVPFNEAIESIQSMFHGFDKDIIELVLRQNKGNMEMTIDVLLEMNGEKPINNIDTIEKDQQQIEQDEVLANMLQNNLFLNELRNDNDFASLFKQQQQLQNTNPPQRMVTNQQPIFRQLTPKEEMDQWRLQQQQLQQQQQFQQPNIYYTHNEYNEEGDSPLTLLEEDFNEIKEKINQLGEAAKNKFKVLTDMFMKKEENQYQPVKTNSNNSTTIIKNTQQSNSEEDEIIVFDKNISRRKGNINSSYTTTKEEDSEDEEYDSFILDNNERNNTIKLRNYKDEIQAKKDN